MVAMYVCVCNGHSDRDIRSAARSGLRCARTIYAQLGKPLRCGRCLQTAERLVQEVHEAVSDERPSASARG